jgi:hypothetical protein
VCLYMPPSVHYMSKACITRPKICIWAVPRYVWSSPDTSWLGNWAVQLRTNVDLMNLGTVLGSCLALGPGSQNDLDLFLTLQITSKHWPQGDYLVHGVCMHRNQDYF